LRDSLFLNDVVDCSEATMLNCGRGGWEQTEQNMLHIKEICG